MMSGSRFSWCVLALTTLVFPAAAQPPPIVVAKTGDVAPGAGGLTYQSFGLRPVVANNGAITFLGFLGAESTDAGLWSGQAGAATLLLRQGQVAPGTSVPLSQFRGSPAMGANGTVAVLGELTSSNDRGIWSGTAAGGVQLLARTGQAAPGVAGSTFGTLFFDQFPAVNAAGQVAFAGNLNGTVTGSGIWTGGVGPESVQLVARTGQAAAGLSGVNYSSFGQLAGGPRLNASGDVIFRASLSDFSSAIFAGPVGALQPVAKTGSQAAGQTHRYIGGQPTAAPHRQLPAGEVAARLLGGEQRDRARQALRIKSRRRRIRRPVMRKLAHHHEITVLRSQARGQCRRPDQSKPVPA
jgi:hypothetical protein